MLSALLDFAGQKILNRCYPYDDAVQDVPARYELLQVEIAVELYSKIGAEGQKTHNENGISRAWESADVSPSRLSEITPFVGVLGVKRNALPSA